tara:strand:+ start:4448 stop:5209 length:762 start_codon:yes stop_codon:yes gene_type:complete
VRKIKNMNKDQDNFSQKYQQMFDVGVRIKKSKKTLAILNDFLNTTNNLDLLDLGCSTGIMTDQYSKQFRKTLGIDIDMSAIDYAKKNYENKNLTFQNCSYDDLTLSNKKFDVVICSHVYEHVDNPDDLFDKIYNLLKKGGICYLVAGNRHKIIEPHFKLPFLSYLPRKLGNLYVKIAKKDGQYYQKHLSLRKLKKLVYKFKIHDYTIKTIKFPIEFSSDDLVKDKSIKQKVYLFFSKIFYFLIPTYIWILEKN